MRALRATETAEAVHSSGRWALGRRRARGQRHAWLRSHIEVSSSTIQSVLMARSSSDGSGDIELETLVAQVSACLPSLVEAHYR